MAFSRVNADWDQQTGSASTLVYTATGLTLTAGNLVEGTFIFNDGGGSVSVSSIVDNKGNTYTIARSITGAAYKGVSFYLANIAGGADPQFTITLSDVASGRTLGFRQWSGAATSSVLSNDIGQAQTAPGSGSNAVSSTAVTPGQDNCLITGWSSGALIEGATAGTGFTLDASVGGPAGTTIAAEHLIQTTATSVAATFTAAGGTPSHLITFVMAFKLPGGGASNTDRQTVVGAATVSGGVPALVVGIVATPQTP